MYYTDLNGNSEPARKHGRIAKSEFVTTWSRDVSGDDVWEVEAGTTGYKGEDVRHGSRVYLRVQDLCGHGLHLWVGDQLGQVETDELILEFCGDAGLNAVKETLRWMISILEAQSEGVV